MSSTPWTDGIAARVGQASQALGDRLPDLISVLVIAVAGLLGAWLLRRLARLLVHAGLAQLDRLEWFHTRTGDSLLYRRAPAVVSTIVFWTVLLVSLIATLEVFDLAGLSAWVRSLAAYVPRLLAGLLLIFLGFLGGDVAHNLVARAAVGAGSLHSQGLSRAVQVLVILVGVILGIEQLGIGSTVLTVALAIIAASTLVATGLAFGLGARTTVANLLAVQQVRGAYQAGDTIQVGDVEGRIVEMTQTAVVLDTDRGRVTVPGQIFSEQITTRVMGD